MRDEREDDPRGERRGAAPGRPIASAVRSGIASWPHAPCSCGSIERGGAAGRAAGRWAVAVEVTSAFYSKLLANED